MTTIPGDAIHRAGELLLVDLDPTRGTEQRGRRPALVVSTDHTAVMTRRVIVCPVTRNVQPWPTKVLLPPGLPVQGAVLVDQIRSLDRDARILRTLGYVPDETLAEVRGRLAPLLGISLTRVSSS
ncbi:type II toxin-antitoxin system PemK/MazF family toxin [Methylorubrum podarium]|jgi:mRNA interferase MazF|uniref:mRNA interferase n=1 Tax=Methylorubrum podarium TaxID=200476 RepID=A0ABV1QMX5_9HYPH